MPRKLLCGPCGPGRIRPGLSRILKALCWDAFRALVSRIFKKGFVGMRFVFSRNLTSIVSVQFFAQEGAFLFEVMGARPSSDVGRENSGRNPPPSFQKGKVLPSILNPGTSAFSGTLRATIYFPTLHPGTNAFSGTLRAITYFPILHHRVFSRGGDAPTCSLPGVGGVGLGS